MDLDRYLSSRFHKWNTQHSPDFSLEQEQKAEGLKILVECVESGEIDSLDGVNSPVSKSIMALHGLSTFEMNANWIGSSQDWSCPCCSRSKLQISRKGNKGQILAKLIVHHDHMGEALETAFHSAFEQAETDVEQEEGLRLVQRMGKAFAGYDEVLICEDCNNADAEAKKTVEAPRFFSFSVGQIRRFIRTRANEPHEIDPQIARDVWAGATPAYKLRMELIASVAYAAATDKHWYESFSGICPVPTISYASYRIGDSAIKRWVGVDALTKALGPTKQVSIPDRRRWRVKGKNKAKSLPANYLAMLRSDPWNSKAWDSLPEEWQCPVCLRTKYETIYINDRGKLKISIASTNGRDAWKDCSRICNHCKSTLMSLKWEIESIILCDLTDSYSFVTPAELTRIIVPHAHSAHDINSSEAEALVASLAARLSPK